MYHYNKYIKYKNKYIGLKNLIGGTTNKKLFDDLIDILVELYKKSHHDKSILLPQTDAHTPIKEEWKQVGDAMPVVDNKSQIKGHLVTIKEPIKISSYHLQFDDELIKKIKNGEIIVNFNFSDTQNCIFPNFWKTHTKDDAAQYTTHIYIPVEGNPYAYHSDTYKEPGNFYRIIARAFTTKIKGEWTSRNLSIDEFNDMVERYDFNQAYVPIRIEYV
jgi:hypothetical protein